MNVTQHIFYILVRCQPSHPIKGHSSGPPINDKKQSYSQPKNNPTPSVHNVAKQGITPHSGLKPPSSNDYRPIHPQQSDPMIGHSISQDYPYSSITFGLNSSTNPKIVELFKHLNSLQPMEKYGSMSGDCDLETTQMEKFLKHAFGFKNLRGEYIVQGVKSFQLDKPVENIQQNLIIRFPAKPAGATNSFDMIAGEICQWQRSYRVYADKTERGMTKESLLRALQGLSGWGAEAFLMKFVVRTSQCPILMEFDGKIISRDIREQWPHNIWLVSVTGIDFAGRIHDIDDIRTYVTNWRDVYELDQQRQLPLVYNGRDFRRKYNAPSAQLDKNRLLNDLKRMASLRLRACDIEGVQIVVETGIGLGVFAGKYIGIDETVRKLSARAVREVLEEDGGKYKHIGAIVFALPIFDGGIRNGRLEDTFHAFASEFHQSNYHGCIPVLIIDQDMHRLTVAIARRDFRVSELNPADSHGVFGEYWQNRGPAVEEKLALTTVGLLVQHHLINPHVLDRNNYYLI